MDSAIYGLCIHPAKSYICSGTAVCILLFCDHTVFILIKLSHVSKVLFSSEDRRYEQTCRKKRGFKMYGKEGNAPSVLLIVLTMTGLVKNNQLIYEV